MPGAMVGDVLLNAGFLHPFIQHHFNRCGGNAELVEHPFAVFRLSGHPLQGFVGKRYRHRVLGLYLLMLDVECFAVSRLVDFVPFQRHHVAVPQSRETRKQKCLFHNLIAARSGNQRPQFLYGQELAHGTFLLWLLLCVQQLERVVVNQPLADCHVQGGGKAVHEDAAGGTAQCLFPVVERAGFQKGDETLAEILVHLFQGKVGLTYI